MNEKENAKEYLLQIKDLTKEVKNQEEYIERLKDSLGIIGMQYDKERVQSSSEHDKFAQVFAQIDEQESILEDLKEKLILTKVKIINMIHELENEKYKNLLNIVYVDMKSLKKAASIMCFSYDYVKELHGDALKTFAQKFLPQTT